MADADSQTHVPDSAEPDIDMAGADDEDGDLGDPAPGLEVTAANISSASNPRTIFLEYLKSPIVELLVSDESDEEPTLLTAHEAILSQSPYFAETITSSNDNTPPLRIELSESLDAITCFLQYQYTGEYFPRRLPSIPDGLEPDPSLPPIDDTGAQLLKHARVYTLAQKLGLPELKTLAHSKIHRINSTAVGEIAYARYVYANTSADDATIRRPVAAFWATRSHVLRHEAEQEFKSMCLEFPQFGFDVLSLVLDQREKRARERETDTPEGKGRKRMRPSGNI